MNATIEHAKGTSSVYVDCLVCDGNFVVSVVTADYNRWMNGGMAQDCFPYLRASQRELLISNTCPACFDHMFGE